MLDALALGGKACSEIDAVHGVVKSPVRPMQVRRHEVGIVEIGQHRTRLGGAGAKAQRIHMR